MATVREIFDYLDTLAPFSIQMSFDNSGFLVGRGEADVQQIMVALDITEEVIEEARALDCQLIVSHHPIMFHPARQITDADPVGRCVLSLIEHGMAAICAHTNLDAVAGGVNDALAQKLELSNIEQLHQDGMDKHDCPYGIGRVGITAEQMELPAFAAFVKEKLQARGLRMEDAGRPVHRVAVGGGACGDLLEDVLKMGCDTFVTADVKYNVFLDAQAMGINLIDAGHFSTENVVCPVLVSWLKKGFPALKVFLSERHKEVFYTL